jgi:hypothetical protein
VPSIDKALDNRRSQIYGGGDSSLWATSANDLMHLGVGVTLYFKLLKYFVGLMFIGILFFAPLLVVYSSGHRVPTSVPDPIGFSKLTLGNTGYGDLIVFYFRSSCSPVNRRPSC